MGPGFEKSDVVQTAKSGHYQSGGFVCVSVIRGLMGRCSLGETCDVMMDKSKYFH